MRNFVYTKPGCEQQAIDRAYAEAADDRKVILLAHSSCGSLQSWLLDRPLPFSTSLTGWFANGYAFDMSPYNEYDTAVHVSIRYKKPEEQK